MSADDSIAKQVSLMENEFASRLRTLIDVRYGKDVGAFARVVSVSESTVRRWLKGDETNITLESLRKIGEQTGVSLDWLWIGRSVPVDHGYARQQLEKATGVG